MQTMELVVNMVLTVSVVWLLFDSVHPREDGEYILQAIDVTVLSLAP